MTPHDFKKYYDEIWRITVNVFESKKIHVNKFNQYRWPPYKLCMITESIRPILLSNKGIIR